MTQGELVEMVDEITAFAEGVRIVRRSLESSDGRTVKACCDQLAITLFKLGEAAKKQSKKDQQWDQ